MSDIKNFDEWYNNRLQLFFHRLGIPTENYQPTINDVIKNEEENNA